MLDNRIVTIAVSTYISNLIVANVMWGSITIATGIAADIVIAEIIINWNGIYNRYTIKRLNHVIQWWSRWFRKLIITTFSNKSSFDCVKRGVLVTSLSTLTVSISLVRIASTSTLIWRQGSTRSSLVIILRDAVVGRFVTISPCRRTS